MDLSVPEYMRCAMGNQLALVDGGQSLDLHDDVDDERRQSPPHLDSPKDYLPNINATMTAATKVVQDVLEQMACKDYPPNVKDNVTGSEVDPVLSPSMMSSVGHNSVNSKGNFHFSSNGSMLQVNQPHSIVSNRSFSITGAASFDTEESSCYQVRNARDLDRFILQNGPTQCFPPDHPVSLYRKMCFDNFRKGDKLGQSSLESLCEWTLHIFEVEVRNRLLEIDTSTGEETATRAVPTTISPANARGSRWRGGKNGTRHKKEYRALKEKKDEPKVRLQMFGSEYARFLSSSSVTRPGSTKKKKRKSMQPPPKVLGRPLFLDEAFPAIQSGAVLDIVVTPDDYPCPDGYYRIRKGLSAFQLSRGKHTWHVDVKKEPNWDKAVQRPCITALQIIFPDRNEFIPPGFSVVRDGKGPNGPSENVGQPADVGTTSERIYLCFRRSREGNPLTGLLPLCPGEGDVVPEGYTVIERSPRNFVADLNQGASGTTPTFLAIRQRLANLEALRPIPLIMAVKDKAEDEEPLYQAAKAKMLGKEGIENYELKGYYSTSGTVVPSAVGRFHILDRSTHTLLSPSSVTNRLSLINKSREKAGKNPLNDSTRDVIASQNSRDYRESSLTASSVKRQREVYALPQTVFPEDYEEYRDLVDALDFIPKVEVAAKREARAPALLRLQARTTLIAPILTACYSRHGGAALSAVEGLYTLLTTTDFFDDDVDLSDDSDHEACSRLTLLDLAIQVVCDVASSGSLETTFSSCVEFVEECVRFSHAQLNIRTVGYVVRFYFFVYYFGASSPTATSDWPSACWDSEPQNKNEGGDISMLLDPRTLKNGSKYLPGGAPQAAALAFKELISLSIIRLGKTSINNSVALAIWEGRGKENNALDSFLESMLNTVVENAVDNVERANLAQIALHQVHRSGGSELFWHDMISVCGAGLFGKDPDLTEAAKNVHITSFALMANLVKVASGKVRSTSEIDLLPRDVASKNLSLELLLHFIEYWSDEQEAVGAMELPNTHSGRSFSTDTLAFSVRRMVVPCLLSNTKPALMDCKIFRRVLRIVVELWRSPVNRSHCRAELGILIDHFFVHFLQLGPKLLPDSKFSLPFGESTISLHNHQLEILRELKTIFLSNPKDALLMFLNYDTDIASDSAGALQPMPGTKWKLFQRLCAALSSIAEQCGEVIAHQIEEHRAKLHSNETDAPEPSSEGLSTSEKAAQRESARKLRTSSLECIALIVRALSLSAGSALGKPYTTLFLSWGEFESSSDSYKLYSEDTSDKHSRQMVLFEEKNDKQLVPFDSSSKSPTDGASSQALEVACGIATKRGLKKAVEYLVACGALTPAPRAIATYLRLHKDRFDSAELGRYLGESGIDSSEKEYWNSIRHSFVRAISFLGMTLDEALRHFLTHGGFRLPGEAQKIDRIINTFAECFFEDNAGDIAICPFPNEDSVYLLCFAAIMLNTDLHKSSSDKNRKAKKKMSKQEFVGNIRNAGQEEAIPKEFLYELYDSIEKRPIVLEGDGTTRDDGKRELSDILKNTQGAESLLRGLAVHDFRFATIEDVARASKSTPESTIRELAKTASEKTWHQWYSVISTCLETAHLDLQGMESCADILLYALTTAVCLDLPAQRAAFLGQLGRLKSFEELRQGRWVNAPDYESFRKEDWYIELEEACSSTNERRAWALRNIREWMGSVQTEIFDDVRNKAALTKAVANIENGDVYLQDPARSFVRSGTLTKKSGRTGRMTQYEFFLFSDLILYTSGDKSGKMKIHEELPLYQLKVTDYFPKSQKLRDRMFEIHHPRKQFHVLCDSIEEKKSWVVDIRNAILNEVDRTMKMEAARISIHSKARG